MRELTKSMLGLSWAMSVFSAQQLGKLIAPSQEALDAAVAEVEEVSKFVQSRLSEAMIRQFRAGDEWQRRIIDATFAAGAPLQVIDPRPLMQSIDAQTIVNAMDPGHMIKSGVDFVQQTADAVRKRAPGASVGVPTVN
ncbi:MAG: hypothetical protein A3H97_04405 [Acidobacteria bacterium RIFCSPLOWO2_02_FULL_65_29]|nr:MAG: hypothetical protein A3H97_04405 [Acidobacteria bacterium RIFCSPLOWO2_02_FULL_65_29]